MRRIRAGSTFRNQGGVLLNIEVAYNHPTYGSNGSDGDITVVRLAGNLQFNPVVQAGTIVSQGTVIPDELAVVHAGWGATSVSTGFHLLLTDIKQKNFKMTFSIVCFQCFSSQRVF
jgi:hypothetical protein